MPSDNLRPPPGTNGPGPAAPAGTRGFAANAWLVFKTVQARLRFVAILVAIGLVIGNWNTLKAYWEKWTRPAVAQDAAAADTEFYCPMHPQVVRDHRDKCPICGMPLSKRKKGEGDDEPLPPGVVSRVQLSPYRVALAGIQTTEVGYQPLAREVRTVGFVEFDERKQKQISARVKGRIDQLFVNVTGQTVRAGDELASLYSPDLVTTVQNLLDAQRGGNKQLLAMARERLRLWDLGDDQVQEMLRTGKPVTHVPIRSPISGHVIRKYQVEGKYVDEGTPLYDVADLSTVWIQAQVYEDDLGLLREGQAVRATTRAFPNRVFRGQVAFIHPHLDRGTRTLTVRFDMDNPGHVLRPGMYATVQLEVPVAQLDLFAAARNSGWRDRTAAEVAAGSWFAPAGPAGAPGLASLLHAAARQTLAAHGHVLAMPESAVIDTGSRKVVYREASPGVYEGVEVQLGPRCGASYPVLSGLGPGERVATSGSFLIDAETRLNPAAGSAYVGVGGSPKEERRSAAAARPSMTEDEDAKVKANLAKLSPEDRRLAEAQQFCPVLGSKLGSMGPPVKVVLDGKPVFLCCKNCVAEAKAHPAETLEKAERHKAKGRAVPPTGSSGEEQHAAPPGPLAAGGLEAKVQAALAELSPEDRRLAEAQRFCPVQQRNRLGAMGPPDKVLLDGKPVFLCCAGCEDEAREHPRQTLDKVERLKAKAGR
jgi:Cu(I)/Ag(I) efflux system membrane fusion protein